MSFTMKEESKRQISTPRTPEQNGIAKRRNISIMECERTLNDREEHCTKVLGRSNQHNSSYIELSLIGERHKHKIL